MLYKSWIKRSLDLLTGILAFPVFLIAWMILSPMIRAEDGGPVFYTAERIGKNGKLFRMYKFRSMHVNAPDIRLADGSTYNGADDPRVTRIGWFMRTTSLDELPQILNILNGTMSVVGPRPDPPDWLDKYPEDIRVFLTVRPGITGYSQAYYRNGADGNQKMLNDAYYARHVSFIFDVKIILRTIAMVLGHGNTYKDLSGEEDAVREAETLKNRRGKHRVQ